MHNIYSFLKRNAFHFVAVLLFVAIAVAYFLPADIEGRILYRHDASAGRGAGMEQQTYLEQTGERTRWTNALFGGMPTYQMAPSYDSTDLLTTVMDAYHLWLPENVWYVFAYLVGFYILLLAFDVRRELAVLGAVLWAFSSYFFIIIAAGHIWKVMALAYLPPLIAGLVYAYGRQRYLTAFLLIAVFTAFEVKANHVQMTYYYLFIILAMIIAYLCSALRQRHLAAFGKATAVCAIGAAIGIGINISNLYHTWQYGKESMRGATELTSASSRQAATTGLDRDYITQWSYGLGETWTLLVPNTKGGASVPLTRSDRAMEKADPQFMPIYAQLGQYWGEQPGTSGPVYVGAFVVMLFVLSLFVVRGAMKWALLAVTILSILLSWGRNFMPLTDFFIDYVPLYAKFRTVASILVVAEFTIPLLAVLCLKELMAQPDLLRRRWRWVVVSYVLTAGLCALFALLPTVFFPDFLSSAERGAMASLPEEYLAPIMRNLTAMRAAVFAADCWRAALIITIGTALLFLLRVRRLSATTTTWLLVVLCLVDMWQVNKRYLCDEMFVPRSQREQLPAPTATDEAILADESLDYRVLNLASNTFNENETSYYHKSIGGYHAAKLQRYQDMITHYIHPEMRALLTALAAGDGDMTALAGDSLWSVLNALNTRYIIVPLQGGQTLPLLNPYAYGNAWHVDSIAYVADANSEFRSIGSVALRSCAVAEEKYRPLLGTATARDSTRSITLTHYQPNELTYTVASSEGGIVVFSEVYYPGWTATIDGNDAPLARADYLLRAMTIPAGNHEVRLTFRPATIRTTETIAYVSYGILLLAVAVGIYLHRRRQRGTGKC